MGYAGLVVFGRYGGRCWGAFSEGVTQAVVEDHVYLAWVVIKVEAVEGGGAAGVWANGY